MTNQEKIEEAEADWEHMTEHYNNEKAETEALKEQNKQLTEKLNKIKELCK